MLVGEPFGGKTKVLETLSEAMTMLNNEGETDYERVINRIINPKSITMGQLFGQFDPVSHEVSLSLTHITFRVFKAVNSILQIERAIMENKYIEFLFLLCFFINDNNKNKHEIQEA